MTGRVSEVRTVITLRLVTPRVDVLVDASLRYDSDDPYAIHLSFLTQSSRDPIDWIFARSLASEGLAVPAGFGDVQIWPSQEGDVAGPVYIELCSPSGRALLAVPRAVLAEFVEQCHQLVPAGEEADYIDLDAELDLLLYDDLS
jgi:hypothetical protein